MSVQAELFIRTWQDSMTAEEAADRLGITPKQATARASHYRNHGIPLQKMPRGGTRGRPRLDVARLSRIARGEE